MDKKKSRLTFDAIWEKPRRSLSAQTDLDLVLVDGVHLPLAQWRENFFFMGGPNQMFKTLTRGNFPAKADPEGTHPVFALKPVAGGIGFAACPCSSSGRNNRKWVDRGTALIHTGYVMKKTCYIIDRFRFNMPPSEALKLVFQRGDPSGCCTLH